MTERANWSEVPGSVQTWRNACMTALPGFSRSGSFRFVTLTMAAFLVLGLRTTLAVAKDAKPGKSAEVAESRLDRLVLLRRHGSLLL